MTEYRSRPEMSPIAFMESSVSHWQTQSEVRRVFVLDICKRMESRVVYDTNFMSTTNGHFGLTTKSKAKKVMMIEMR
ncbi:hypothetical protein BKA67DRAFT_576298 [Truncatella angustata]|uniref:Uncharacterized protein n=1 Tax=Truncatella angustata TaxID=152316 RepID=A0A9P8ZU53_9PEZI|nr:uncharacterized protein BKA67DRAFT_576298 [Truncatella angustata]KAH6648921.1 hypothetical protein BKA67DRAFT_576298 [Truncatella angustata]